MKLGVYILAAGIAVIVLHTGCVTRYPMGLNKEQWEALPAEQQAAYRAQQYAADEARRESVRAERLQREQAARTERAAERARIDALYARASYGDIVRVTIEGGMLAVYGRKGPAQPCAFDIVKGEHKVVTVTQIGNVRHACDFVVHLSDDGNTLLFDADDAEPFVMVNTDWERGQTYISPTAGRKGRIMLLGAKFSLKLKEIQGAPARLIIENR